ncbi:30S ribosomal protein S4 [Scatolibacter rhodanostii]|uniref:30S ribosomal protein S4 n=1 Tax=Scatolibacter rhodanostii TaxID=2014781 RepID=UPI000C08AAE5|nr:30S ribosomal protein S4 [Scatolibacter rhodanostii]
MARERTPVLKKCRALGIEPSVLGITKKPSKKGKNVNTRRKVSEYGLQLREKQKAKFIYGLLEKQFHNLYLKATKMPGMAGENLLSLLEQRLDNTIYRIGFARTRAEARQFVCHGHVLVNGKKVDIASVRVKPGDVISIREKSIASTHVKDVLAETEKTLVPKWLNVNRDKHSAEVLAIPTKEDIDFELNERLIVELYSK